MSTRQTRNIFTYQYISIFNQLEKKPRPNLLTGLTSILIVFAVFITNPALAQTPFSGETAIYSWGSFLADSTDTTPPDLSITSPADGEEVPNTGFPVTGTAGDSSGISTVFVAVNDYGTGNLSSPEVSGTSSWICFVSSDMITSGYQAEITVMVLDTASNWSTDTVVVNVKAIDPDGDGIPNDVDNCPYAINPDQTNSDNDSHGDACDNCPYVDNQDQANSNGDGVGDACNPIPTSSTTTSTNLPPPLPVTTTTTTIGLITTTSSTEPNTTTTTTLETTSTTSSTSSSSTTSTTSISQLWPMAYDEMWGEKQYKNLLLLRAFRDGILLNTKTGRKFIYMLYDNSIEIALLLLQDPSLNEQTRMVIDELLPSVESLLYNDEMKINQDTLHKIVSLLNQFEPKASPKLKTAIKKVKKDLERGKPLKQLGIIISK